MLQDESEKTLIEILDSRWDTGFNGHEISQSKVEIYEQLDHGEVVKDESGSYYSTEHDYIGFRLVDGERVGVLVADEDGQNCIDHSRSELPHPIGLYVRESHRSQGIATELIDEFINTVDADTCVIDCETAVMPFYMQLDWDIIYLSQVKRGQDPTQPPLIEIDASVTPDHGLPVLEPGSDELDAYLQRCEERQAPAVYVAIDDSIAQSRVPSSHELAGEPPMRHYTSEKAGDDLYEVVITMDTISQGITFDAMEELQQIPGEICAEYTATGRRAWIQRRDETDTIDTWRMPLSDAKEVADEVYTIVSDKKSLSMEENGFVICR